MTTGVSAPLVNPAPTNPYKKPSLDDKTRGPEKQPENPVKKNITIVPPSKDSTGNSSPTSPDNLGGRAAWLTE